VVEPSISRHGEEHDMKVCEIVRKSSLHFNIGIYNND